MTLGKVRLQDNQENAAIASPLHSPDYAECGWREDIITQPDGRTDFVWTVLTEEEFLHPKEGYHLPSNTFHDRIVSDLKDMLIRWFQPRSDVGVFGDLLIKWDIDLKDHCPDTFVAFGLQDVESDRSEFVVAEEGVRPVLIIEVVSPRYRRADRETKVLQYAQAQVQEYIIVDRRKYRGQTLEEVLGYRLIERVYQPITPDEEGRIFSQVAGLWISLREGKIVLEDVQTGERLLTARELEQRSQEAEQRAEEERQRAEEERQRAEEERQRAEEERQRAEEAEQRAQNLADFLRSQGFDPDQF
jgi:Uma2 family endonuclease